MKVFSVGTKYACGISTQHGIYPHYMGKKSLGCISRRITLVGIMGGPIVLSIAHASVLEVSVEDVNSLCGSWNGNYRFSGRMCANSKCECVLLFSEINGKYIA